MNTYLLGDLTNKTILMISGERSDSTHELAACMAGGRGKLIVTAINDEHFPTIRKNLEDFDLAVDFIRTSALKLAGVRPGSIDLLICNYSLSTINAIVGQGELALHKFYKVLKPGGLLYIEEELPLYMAASPAQAIWAEKWRLLKAAQMLSGNRSTNEYQPDVLEALVTALGFEDVDVADELATLSISDWWGLFQTRFEYSLNGINSQSLKAALIEISHELETNAQAIGIIEIPFAILTAKKPWRIE